MFVCCIRKSANFLVEYQKLWYRTVHMILIDSGHVVDSKETGLINAALGQGSVRCTDLIRYVALL